MIWSEFVQVVNGIFNRSFLALMDNLSLEAVEISDSLNQDDIFTIASIDGGSEDFEMIVTLKLPLATLEASLPTTHSETSEKVFLDESVLEDWLCEITNLLMGWVKASLLDVNCQFQLGLPKTHHGSTLASALIPEYDHHYHKFSVEKENCECVVSIHCFSDTIKNVRMAPQTDEDVTRSEIVFL